MLVLRDEQLRRLGLAARHRFLDWLVRHLRDHWWDQIEGLDQPALRRLVRDMVARAESFGITEGPNIARYVNLEMLLGPGFAVDDRIPWAGQVLRDPDLLESQKLRILRSLVDASDLAELSG